MNILEICPYSLDSIGGVQVQVLGLAKALTKLGHRVVVVGPGGQNYKAARTSQDESGYLVVRTGPATEVEANGSIAPIAVGVGSTLSTLSTMRQNRFDVVHLHEPLVPGPCLTALLASKAPVVGTFHLSGPSASYKYLAPVVRKMATRLSVRCAVSPMAENTAHSSLGGDYRVLYNAVDSEKYRTHKTSREDTCVRIVFVGRHEKRKGLGVLIEAYRRLISNVSIPCELVVVGTGPDTAGARAASSDLNSVVWAGQVDEEALIDIMASCDIFCAPSLSGESFGVVLVEAMASGLAVVASNIEGYSHVAAGACELFAPGDVDALESSLTRVVQDSGLRKELSTLGRERAKEFDIVKLASHYQEIFSTLATKGID